jgi:small subunit ribosomal protein S6
LSNVFISKGGNVPSYELVYIVSPEINEDELPKVLDRVSDMTNKIGGSVTEVVQWGRKKLAYPIQKFIEGHYVLAKLEIEAASAKELETSLRLYDEILRYLLIRLKF